MFFSCIVHEFVAEYFLFTHLHVVRTCYDVNYNIFFHIADKKIPIFFVFSLLFSQISIFFYSEFKMTLRSNSSVSICFYGLNNLTLNKYKKIK